MIETFMWCAIHQAVLEHNDKPLLWAFVGGSAVFLLGLLFVAVWFA